MDQVTFYSIIPDLVLVLTRSFSTIKRNIVPLSAPSATANLILRRQWIKFVFSPVLGSRILTFFQHYDVKHRFECPECDDEFTTQAAMNQVSFSSTAQRLAFFTRIRSTTIKPIVW